jgi:hypothetical protein
LHGDAVLFELAAEGIGVLRLEVEKAPGLAGHGRGLVIVQFVAVEVVKRLDVGLVRAVKDVAYG